MQTCGLHGVSHIFFVSILEVISIETVLNMGLILNSYGAMIVVVIECLVCWQLSHLSVLIHHQPCSVTF